MNSNQHSARSITPIFRYLLLATAILAFVLVLLGVIVRVTDSSSACPDWPTCSGGWIAPIGSPAFLRFLHRVIVAMTGIGMLASLVYAWRHYRKMAWVVRPLAIASGLMAIQVIMGRLDLLQEDLPGLSAIHFSLALGVLGVLFLDFFQGLLQFFLQLLQLLGQGLLATRQFLGGGSFPFLGLAIRFP